MRARWWVEWAVIFALWSLFAAYMALQAHYNQQIMGWPITWGHAFRAEYAYAYVWALLTPVILWLARRFRLDHRGWYRAAPLHILACLVLAAVQKTAYLWLAPPSREEFRPHDLAGLARSIFLTMDYAVMLYGIVLLIHYTVVYYARYQEGRVRSSQLETRLVESQLHALKMQLHPHFLFNTLHSISSLVQEDPEKAENMIARLSELLRLSLENPGAQEVPLSKELEFIERYLEIEQIRFDRLHIRFDIDPQTLDAQVPNLILQPLVENAIHHGMRNGRGGQIEIRSQQAEGKLQLQVIDDGMGLQAGSAPARSGSGMGLSNTRARLEAIYGKEHNFVLRSASNGGVEAAITIPLQAHPPPEAHGSPCQDPHPDSG